jgi:hypothetical protein
VSDTQRFLFARVLALLDKLAKNLSLKPFSPPAERLEEIHRWQQANPQAAVKQCPFCGASLDKEGECPFSCKFQ